jgi:hypothetical protein
MKFWERLPVVFSVCILFSFPSLLFNVRLRVFFFFKKKGPFSFLNEEKKIIAAQKKAQKSEAYHIPAWHQFTLSPEVNMSIIKESLPTSATNTLITSVCIHFRMK